MPRLAVVSGPREPNLLEQSGLPIAYPVAPAAELTLGSPDTDGYDVAARSAVRSLTLMQKEAVVTRTGSGLAWRLSSDEGPYLQGHDFAPAPLAFLTTGFAADIMVTVRRSMAAADLACSALRVVLDTHFSIEGSLPRKTMVGGAAAPEITVYLDGCDPTAATGAVMTGVVASATAGLAVPSLRSLFSLTSGGAAAPLEGVVAMLEEPPPGEERMPPRFPGIGAVAVDEPIITKLESVGTGTPDAGVSLQEEQHRTLHLQAKAIVDHRGLTIIETKVHRPVGSAFRFVSDEPAGRGGQGRAPDGLTYISAGIGFCFMTQLGRYAKIRRRSLGDYRIVQDTRFSYGRPDRDPPVGGRADAPHTHVYLEPDEPDFGPDALAMSEQTCFVHALCRTALRPKVKVLAQG